ncbi:DUF952 domain-containing protein [Chloroflexi bacterium TSY]|nr:DUF952 domain-containing protein [Chloroflexi bacterium TSY]
MSEYIYHILPLSNWQEQNPHEPYRGDTLRTEGFIHCTGERELLVLVADANYRSNPSPFVVLCIDESKVVAQVKWEEADSTIFPHIYGPLNLDAVIDVVEFPRGSDGLFCLPKSWVSKEE